MRTAWPRRSGWPASARASKRGSGEPTARFASALRATNPHAFDLGGVSFLGTSGQNVDDVLRYSTLRGRLDALAALLEWGHVAPTAPDTLPAYPFKDRDPFVLPAAPHVFFAGGAPAFEVGDARGARLVCVPDFGATGMLVLLNLRTLACHPVAVELD